MNAEQCIANQILNQLLHSIMFSPVNAKQCMGNQIKTRYWVFCSTIIGYCVKLVFKVY